MVTLAALATLLFSANAPAAPTLRDAIAAYQALDDPGAIAAFQKILATAPSREVAAKAHLYLGLIAFNALHPDLADAEFKKAIEANPAIDLPNDSSPKAALAFAEARREVTEKLARDDRVTVVAPAPTQPQLTPPAAPPAPAVTEPVVGEASPPGSHVLAFSLGGAALLLAVVAVVGAVEVQSFEGTRNTIVNGTPGVTYGSATAQQSTAQVFQPLAIGCGIGAGLLAGGAVLAW